MKNLIQSVLLTGILVLNSVANASITLVFDETSVSSNDTGTATGASATVNLSFSEQVADSSVLLTMTFDNTTGDFSFGNGATESKFTGFAFDLDNAVNSIGTFSGGTFFDTEFSSGTSFPPFTDTSDNFDYAVGDNNNFLGGNANGALAKNDGTDIATVVLNTDLSFSQLEQEFFDGLSSGDLRFAARFMQIDNGENDDKLLGGTVVPEPSTYALIFSVVSLITVIGCRSRSEKA